MKNTFAQRHGYRPIRQAIQFESMDDALRFALWDTLRIALDSFDSNAFYYREYRDPGVELFYAIWSEYFHQPTDTVPKVLSDAVKKLREYFFKAEWFDVLSLIEFVADNLRAAKAFVELANHDLEREMSAYRFVEGVIVPITDDVEIEAIETAVSESGGPVGTHLMTALGYLSDRKNPDYRNSIKESISAVEAAAREIAHNDKATLSDALRVLPGKLHPAFRDALTKLYGYTSDKDGIRHALRDDPDVTFDEAKFMLVVCSAFVNFLRERAGRQIK